jgi:hypothetical protein
MQLPFFTENLFVFFFGRPISRSALLARERPKERTPWRSERNMNSKVLASPGTMAAE